MEVNKDNIEFMKRRLKDYGYYTKKIEECQRKLDDITLRFQDCYQVSGLRYDQPMNSSNPYFSRIQSILNEEGEVQTKKEDWEQKRNALKLDHLLYRLSKDSRELIELHYFREMSQNYIAVNKQYKYIEALKRKIKRIIVFLVKNY